MYPSLPIPLSLSPPSLPSSLPPSLPPSLPSLPLSQSSLAVTVSEPLTNGITIDLTVVRGPGVFGRVSVDFEVSGNQMSTHVSHM